MTGKKETALIKLKKTYSIPEDFLQDVFFKKPELAKIALLFIQKVYTSFKGVPANEWQMQITEFFGVYQPKDEELLKIKELYEKNFSKPFGLKPYQELLKVKNILSEEELEIVAKAAKWNSCISSYYSVLNKLKALGIIERKKGHYVKSSNFSKNMKNISDMFEEQILSGGKVYSTR